MLYKLSVNRKHVVVAGDWNLTLVKKWELPVIQILLFLPSFSFFLFSCKFHLFFLFYHPLMFKFIEDTYQIAPGQLQLYLKNNSRKKHVKVWFPAPRPCPPPLPPARLGRTPDDPSALWFGALMVCVWNFETNGNSSETGKMQSTGR